MVWLILAGALIAFFVVVAITRRIIRALITGAVILIVGLALFVWMLNQGIISL